jgi:hypothetical protein
MRAPLAFFTRVTCFPYPTCAAIRRFIAAEIDTIDITFPPYVFWLLDLLGDATAIDTTAAH